ncbi:beta-ketoacyl-ACP synthase [Zavarzinia compransoris]|uniref:beta-ketoacyl-ACP synthase n=1 Tax=Zavarzinia marina TaxID=2911065 RepID=UPI001F335645|nr:beta-ketoacyl-ACP synthase [Zavarzinia marina]MCF4165521.1 beta-ketoacyl-ACP synthase [Zavarzinia marina]
MTREVWITGQGLLSPLGQDLNETWDRLSDEAAIAAAADHAFLPPFTVMPMTLPALDRFVPKRGDQRAMGPFMLAGCIAAAMAMDEAGLLGAEPDVLKQINLMVGVGGGERDEAVDEAILTALNGRDDGDVLAEQLQTELRPTLFLAQLPNLFAGNISIVLGVSGSSRTFMGEEASGVDAVRVAYERIQGGQDDLFLVGSAFNASRRDIPLLYQAGGFLLEDPALPFWRRPKAGMALGSAGAFLVIESRESAEARGAKPLARLSGVLNDRCRREPGQASANAAREWAMLAPKPGCAVLSGACGSGPATAEEHDFLMKMVQGAEAAQVRPTAAALGHSIECSFLTNLVLATKAVREGKLFPALTDDPVEAAPAADVTQAVVTTWGHRRGEGMALVERI